MKLTAKTYPFTSFLLDKYEEGMHAGYIQANEDGARYHDVAYWFDDQDHAEEVAACGGDIEADRKEWEAMISLDTNQELLKEALGVKS